MRFFGKTNQQAHGAHIRFRCFLPSWDMASSWRAKLAATLRPVFGWIPGRVGSGHFALVRYTAGFRQRSMSAANHADWRTVFPAIPPANFFDVYMPDLCPERALRSHVGRSRRTLVYFVFALAGGGSIVARRVIDLQRKYVKHDYLISHDIAVTRRQQLKIASRLLYAAVNLYQALDIRVIYLTAGLSAGGRLWPKYGFRPRDSDQWRLCKPRIMANLEKMPADVQNRWAPVVRDLVDQADPRNMRIIHRLNELVPDVLNPQRQRRLGEVLLTGTRWKGVLELNDRTSRILLRDALMADIGMAI